MGKNGTTSRIQKRNRKSILDAGLEVFSQFGFGGSTLDQIAETAGLSKPNLLYYFPSKEAIHINLLESLLDKWIDPLRALDPAGDPIEEIKAYANRKLEMSREFPRESRLFANEILQGAPRISKDLENYIKPLVDEKAKVIFDWVNAAKISSVDPYHLIFSIWAMTQHYSDFDVQVRTILEKNDPFPDAKNHLNQILDRILQP